MHANLGEVGYAQEEADAVQNVGLAAAVEPGNGVEKRVEAAYLGPPCVRLEAIQHNLLYVHLLVAL